MPASRGRVLFTATTFAHERFQSNENLGAVEVATFLGMTLYGLSLAQGYTFFSRSSRDRMVLKLFVSILLFMETFHSFVAAQTVYLDTVTKWGTAEPNSYPLTVTVYAEIIITFMVQSFFCHRVQSLSGSYALSGSCLVLAILRFGGGIALGVESFLDVPRTPNGEFVATFSWLITLTLALGATADILIAFAMSYYLRQFASPSNFRSTTDVLNRLVRWSLQTGIITSLASISVIISFQAMSNMVWFALYIPVAKLYSISFLVLINSRQQNKRDMMDLGRSKPEVGVSDLEFGSIERSMNNPEITYTSERAPAVPSKWQYKL